MKRTIPFAMLSFLALAAAAAPAQFYKLHNGSISVGATGQFTTVLTSNPSNVNYTYPITPGNVTTVTINGQQQYTANSVGFLTSLQAHPASWAGIELNYGYTHYAERFNYGNNRNSNITQLAVPTDWHETTAAYLVHARFIPLQPYIGIGGGAIDFNPRQGPNQWRGAALLETGFDLPVKHTHMGLRIGARSLYYRAPNFNSAQISTRSWRVTAEPEISTYYRF